MRDREVSEPEELNREVWIMKTVCGDKVQQTVANAHVREVKLASKFPPDRKTLLSYHSSSIVFALQHV